MKVEQNFIYQIGLFSLYQVFIAITHVLVISLISFIHFQLGHGISIVEMWVYEHAWEVLIVTKCLSFILIYKILMMYSLRSILKDLMSDRNYLHYQRRSLVFILFFIFFILYIGKPVQSEVFSFEAFELTLSFIGTGFFYGVDFLVILLIGQLFSIKHFSQILISGFLFSLLFSIASLTTFLYQRNMNFLTFVFFYILVSFFSAKQYMWNISLYFLVLFILPLATLFGVDPIKGGEFSPFVLSHQLQPLIVIFLFIISFIYVDGRILNRFKGVIKNASK